MNPNKCFYCKKKINITNCFECECKENYCSKHRYPDSHDCKKSDFRKQRDIQFLKENLVKIEYDKISII
jgi:hypothetical protein